MTQSEAPLGPLLPLLCLSFLPPTFQPPASIPMAFQEELLLVPGHAERTH